MFKTFHCEGGGWRWLGWVQVVTFKKLNIWFKFCTDVFYGSKNHLKKSRSQFEQIWTIYEIFYDDVNNIETTLFSLSAFNDIPDKLFLIIMFAGVCTENRRHPKITYFQTIVKNELRKVKFGVRFHFLRLN